MAGWQGHVTAFAGGALFTLALAPFHLWPLAILSPALLLWVVRTVPVGQVLLRFYLFNVGLFLAGTSWIYVSIHEHGGAGPLLAACLVGLFVASYSLVSLPLAYCFAVFYRINPVLMAIGFSGLWVLQEWFRGWFLTGFPWLYSGYSLLDTPVSGLATITGVLGLSLLVILVAVSLVMTLASRRAAWLTLPVLLIPLALLVPSQWTTAAGSISVSLVQGNVDQRTKWLSENRRPILERYRQMSSEEWGRDLVIWPEAALTFFREQGADILSGLDRRASAAGSALLLGIPDRDAAGGFQNTILALGTGEGQYIKRRLVPFGEYVPLEDYLRGIIRFFDLPMSRNETGPDQQPALQVGDLLASVSICYEVVYPELVRTSVVAPDLLVTVSNDTWFGDSIGPHQHLQMARMRALENGRGMARATNNGVTALIDHRGRVIAALPQFEAGVLRGDLEVRSGTTPYHRWGVYPVLMLSLLLLVLPLLWHHFRRM